MREAISGLGGETQVQREAREAERDKYVPYANEGGPLARMIGWNHFRPDVEVEKAKIKAQQAKYLAGFSRKFNYEWRQEGIKAAKEGLLFDEWAEYKDPEIKRKTKGFYGIY